MKDQKPLVALIGPTAVGKTALSIELAQRLDAEIISADSRLLYIGMDIGTAKPSPEERSRVPHHLIDVAKPDEIWSLAMYQQAAHQVIESIHRRGHLPILVGGTGQYISAILEGWRIPQVEPNPGLRRALERWTEEITPEGLYHRLAVLDPQAAAKIDYQNIRRTIRALEVILTSGEKFSRQRERSIPPFRILVLGLMRPRRELYDRIDTRIDAMVKNGLIEEVRELLESGYSPQLPTMSAIGYREIVAVVQKRTTLEEAIKEMKRKTRIFVRRQANWFKMEDRRIQWFGVNNETMGEMEKYISAWLTADKTA